MDFNPLSAKKSRVQSESDSPSGFAVPYHFSIPSTCGFAFRHAGTCFMSKRQNVDLQQDRRKHYGCPD